jgi:hypothetical protein
MYILLRILVLQEIVAWRISSKSKIYLQALRNEGFCFYRRPMSGSPPRYGIDAALYQSGIDEQDIMGRTGQRLEKGVRAFKRSNMQISSVKCPSVWIRTLRQLSVVKKKHECGCENQGATEVLGSNPHHHHHHATRVSDEEESCVPIKRQPWHLQGYYQFVWWRSISLRH